MINFEKWKKEFEKYVNNYDLSNPDINLKYLHTFRVVSFSELIAKSLKLSDDDIELAKLIGLLHDIGRFEQIKIYNTFNDLKSVNHADLGVKILEDNNYINNYIKNENDKIIVIKTIANHNKLAVEDGLDDRTRLFCNIIRDADKLDIIEMYIKGLFSVEANAGMISHEVLKSVFNKEPIINKNIVSKIDDYIGKIAYIFDLNYNYSLKYIYDNGLIIYLIDQVIKNNNQEKKKLLIVRRIVLDYLTIDRR